MWYQQQAQGAFKEPRNQNSPEADVYTASLNAETENTETIGESKPKGEYVENREPRLWKVLEDGRTGSLPGFDAVHVPLSQGGEASEDSLTWFVRMSRRVRQRTGITDIALALVAVLLTVVLAIATIHPRTSPGRLTWFESFLVKLGLAEAPLQTPQQVDNPSVTVWVDVHTGLYYCPGTDLYGKTPGGRFAIQQDARSDRFQPASGTYCQ
jgi:hypothetical protein